MYILVLRDTTTGRSYHWENKYLDQLFYKARKKFQRKVVMWTPAMDEYLLMHYGTKTAKDLAKDLSKRARKRVSANAAIGQYHRLKKAQKCQIVQS